jgi:lipoyl(octanoyl) transferase
VTTHGFALNVNTDMEYFKNIKPCGLSGEVMTSMSELTGSPIEIESVVKDIVNSFSEIFGLNCDQGNNECLIPLDGQSG